MSELAKPRGQDVELNRSVAEAEGIFSTEIPHVTIYSLAEDSGINHFLDALELSDIRDINDKDKLLAAMDAGVVVDKVPTFLKSKFKLISPVGLSPQEYSRQEKEYIEKEDLLENSAIIQYSWIKGPGEFVRLPHERDFNSVAFSRNKYIISEEIQEALKNVTVGVAGAGVGASVALDLVHTGVKNLVIADGGVLDPHNINRNPLTDMRDLGQNLAVLLSRRALLINPYVNVACIPQNLSENGEYGAYSARDFLSRTDYVFEEMDNLPMKMRLRELAKEMGKPVLMVSDLNMGEHVQIDDANPANPILGGRLTDDKRSALFNPEIDPQTRTGLVIDIFFGGDTPDELVEPLRQAAKAGERFFPQSRIAASKNGGEGTRRFLELLEYENLKQRQR